VFVQVRAIFGSVRCCDLETSLLLKLPIPVFDFEVVEHRRGPGRD